MKVRILWGDCIDMLEEKINNFLSKEIKVIDIKYSSCYGKYEKSYTALIMYED